MTKPKADKPARERAGKGDTSNEGAAAERKAIRAKLLRMQRAIANEVDRGYRLGWQRACGELYAFLNGRAERYSVVKGGLRGPGKGPRRAQ